YCGDRSTARMTLASPGWLSSGRGCLGLVPLTAPSSLRLDLLLAFLLELLVLPTLLVSYPLCQWSRKCWVRYIKWKYPHCIVVEESTARSIMDQGRNQGIYTLLVECPTISIEQLRNHLIQLASTKPLLRLALTTKYFRYAWEKLDEFSIDNHVIVAPSLFKGRPINESNIQDYVSDTTSKFLGSNSSPWQVHSIGSGRYWLVRAHHQLLRQEQLALGDFLPLERARWHHGSAALHHHRQHQHLESPLVNVYAEPEALPRLHQKLTESFSNVWNEFLSNNDPTERPEILKKRVSLWQCAKIAVIVGFTILKEISKKYRRQEGLGFIETWSILTREANKRNFSLSLVLRAFLNLLDPLETARTSVAWIWYLGITLTLKVPILAWREVRAASLLHEHHYYPDSLVSILSCYLPLMFRASLEVISMMAMALGAPFAVTEELFRSWRYADLRSESQSGRKVVAWSDEVELELLDKISAVSGTGHCEILLTAAVDSLKDYFRCSGQSMPEELLATAKFTSQRSLYTYERESKGLLCLALPTKTPLFDDDVIEILQVVQKNVEEARRKQRAIYAITAAEAHSGLVTSCIPSILLKIGLNHLSRKYSISVTQVDGELPAEGIRSAVFWKPPQGNCKLSMTLHRHGEVVRLAVMADAVMGPQHAAITRGFARSLHKLALTLGVQQPQQLTQDNPVSIATSSVSQRSSPSTITTPTSSDASSISSNTLASSNQN
ncbi:hypothetical protein QAD02_015441, partial [Eretmocerus hayati]